MEDAHLVNGKPAGADDHAVFGVSTVYFVPFRAIVGNSLGDQVFDGHGGDFTAKFALPLNSFI